VHNAIVRESWPRRHDELAASTPGYGRMASDVCNFRRGHVGCGQDRKDAGRRAGCCDIDRENAGKGLGRTHEIGISLPRQMHVIDETAAAPRQCVVLET
jgi:hypothetical protein